MKIAAAAAADMDRRAPTILPGGKFPHDCFFRASSARAKSPSRRGFAKARYARRAELARACLRKLVSAVTEGSTAIAARLMSQAGSEYSSLLALASVIK